MARSDLASWSEVDAHLERVTEVETPCRVKWPHEPQRWCWGCTFAAARDAALGIEAPE